jgi:hypothetical protein
MVVLGTADNRARAIEMAKKRLAGLVESEQHVFQVARMSARLSGSTSVFQLARQSGPVHLPRGDHRQQWPRMLTYADVC